MHFDATRQTTLCTFHRHDYGSFQQFLGSSDFFADNIPAVRKKCVPLPILSICFVTKTKITIWAESTIGISPFFFYFQKFYRTVIIYFSEPQRTQPWTTFKMLSFFVFVVVLFHTTTKKRSTSISNNWANSS